MKKTSVTGIVVAISILALFLFVKLSSGKKSTGQDYAFSREGKFEIAVSGAGIVLPERSVDIKGPDMSQYRSLRVTGLKITDIIPEGTRVKKGDYIATLDRTNFDNTLKDEMTNLKTLQDQMDMKILDTAVVLSNLRDDIKNQVFTVEEARITVAQSKYEPPATIRRAELDLDETVRFLEQKKNLYSLQRKQSIADIRNLKVNLDIEQRKVDDPRNVLTQFVIKAAADGMLIYKADRSGVKIKSCDDVVYIPAECVQTGEDSIPFVYTKEGKKQIVIPGETNDKNMILEKG